MCTCISLQWEELETEIVSTRCTSPSTVITGLAFIKTSPLVADCSGKDLNNDLLVTVSEPRISDPMDDFVLCLLSSGVTADEERALLVLGVSSRSLFTLKPFVLAVAVW